MVSLDELEVLGRLKVGERELEVVSAPSPLDSRSWPEVREKLLTWRPQVVADVLELNGLACPVVGNRVILLDEETSAVLRELLSLFHPRAPPDVFASAVVGNVLNEMERQVGRAFTNEERVSVTLKLVMSLSLLVDLGVIR
ncbi:hypothetical protein HS1genome_0384 [Sulfodiicoccus acidiphilus]|uniref:Uncharacterized protein n=1 Tax=Sulfodiicoccus acidiphilus TaxID=1670455 RepID=A0A348B1E3_9CREN|nr:hypothetical protein [Sulfodiicoccus acidiphilus]BBD71995.1 hypothetical protein HS1genome_0384 [Sulfodiicoccus acidiphilus]GGT91995.1 hypothetical protein GCM10007116_07220 [Sulfodiicoccus acidiphilus]